MDEDGEARSTGSEKFGPVRRARWNHEQDLCVCVCVRQGGGGGSKRRGLRGQGSRRLHAEIAFPALSFPFGTTRHDTTRHDARRHLDLELCLDDTFRHANPVGRGIGRHARSDRSTSVSKEIDRVSSRKILSVYPDNRSGRDWDVAIKHDRRQIATPIRHDKSGFGKTYDSTTTSNWPPTHVPYLAHTHTRTPR